MLRELTRPLAAVRRSHTTATDDVVQRRARRRLLLLAGLAVLATVAYMVVGLTGSLSFALPRRATTVATMVLVAYAVGVSTVLFQTVTTNRILTPSIMGFDSLYVLIQTVAVAGLGAAGASAVSVPARFAIEVGLMVAFAVVLYRWLFTGGRHSLHLLLLVGIVIGVLFRSISSFIQRLIDPNEFVVLQDRLFASFIGVDETLLLVAAGTVVMVSAAAWRMRHTFDVLGLGRETAINLGVEHQRAVTQILVLVTLLVAVSTALVGPITFFGLLVANLGYQLMGTSQHRRTLPAAVLLGVVALVGGQVILERVFGLDTVLSVIVEFLGGIVFILMLIRGSSR